MCLGGTPGCPWNSQRLKVPVGILRRGTCEGCAAPGRYESRKERRYRMDEVTRAMLERVRVELVRLESRAGELASLLMAVLQR